MRIKCTSTDFSMLPAVYRDAGHSELSDYLVQPGEEYWLAAIGWFGGRLEYLVVFTDGFYLWVPAPFFEDVQQVLPGDWWYGIHSGLQTLAGMRAILSYKELAVSRQHFSGVTERDPDHASRFLDEMRRRGWGQDSP